jgi:hypothetical protein
MADEANLGTAAIRRRVAAVRAQAGAAEHPPALPPDEAASPWAHLRPPAPERVTKPQAVELVPDTSEPKSNGASKPKPKQALPNYAWKLVDELLQSWAKEQKTSIRRADGKLAERLMRNGAAILEAGIPMDSVGSLIRLSRELVGGSEGSEDEDKRIAEIKKLMAREESTIPAPAEAPPADAEEEEENGE